MNSLNLRVGCISVKTFESYDESLFLFRCLHGHLDQGANRAIAPGAPLFSWYIFYFCKKNL